MTRFSKLEQDDIQAEADDEQIADTKYFLDKGLHNPAFTSKDVHSQKLTPSIPVQSLHMLISLSPCHLEGVTPLIQCLVDRIKGQQLMAQTSFLPELKCCYLYHLKWKL
jgi:hypothetical protein